MVGLIKCLNVSLIACPAYFFRNLQKSQIASLPVKTSQLLVLSL